MFRKLKFDLITKKDSGVVRLPILMLEFDAIGASFATVDLPEEQQTEETKTERVRIDWLNTVVVQSSGTLDKAGKEIWQGDILKDAEESLHEVVFYNGSYHVLMGAGEEMHGVVLDDKLCRTLERVGDIFQNANLFTATENELKNALDESKERTENK